MRIRSTCLTGALFLLLSTSAFAQPGVATLNSPNGDVVGSTIAFTWQSVATADQYQLWIGKTDASLISDTWYTKEGAGCAAGATCHVTVTPRAWAGGFNWYIRAWSSAGGYGAWSAATTFTLNDPTQAWSGKLPATRRFTLVLDNQGVLDNETGLVWQQAPSSTLFQWYEHYPYCLQLTAGGRRGWRSPTITELASLTETSGATPRLPAGHPFTLPTAPVDFWSSSHPPGQTGSYIFAINFSTDGAPYNALYSDPMTHLHKIWCVRTGTSSPVQ
jgi:hypothetical protein